MDGWLNGWMVHSLLPVDEWMDRWMDGVLVAAGSNCLLFRRRPKVS